MNINIPVTNKPRVVIVGGGFAGLYMARTLKGADFQVVLIDRHNYHTFQPLLYQVATAGLEPDSIAYPIRRVLQRYADGIFRMAEVQRIDSAAKRIETNIGEIGYDYLVLATGSATNFFGNAELEKRAIGMKNIREALNIRSLMLQNLERAASSTDAAEREALTNFLIVGAGPSGVETAGALAEFRSHILSRDYPDLTVELNHRYADLCLLVRPGVRTAAL